MSRLPEPGYKASARGRLIAARARAIADLAKQVSEYKDPLKVTPEEWDIVTSSFNELLKELDNEIQSFASQTSSLV